MTRSTGTLIKFTIFGVVMAILTAFLFFIFSECQNRFGERLFGCLQRCFATEGGGHRPDRRASGSAP